MRAVAERNVEAILDAAERLLRERREPNISAVAAQAGLSRPTVYGHFKDRTTLLEAVVERAVRGAMAEVDKADLEAGRASDALERLLGAAWNEIGHSVEIADAALAELSADAMRRSHASGRDRVHRLFERGRATGEFRTDVPTEWLVSACFSLIHTARDDVSAGVLAADTARAALVATMRSLVAPPD